MHFAMRAARAAVAGSSLALLAACATVPDLDRFLLQTEQVRLEGSRGALTHAQSQKIIEELKRRSPETGILDRHVAVEEALSGNPLSVGNKVIPLEDGQQTYTQMLNEIKGAKHHVHMEMYIFEDDEVGQLFAVAMKARASAGVRVRLIYDSVGSINTPKSFFKDMADAGVEVVEFNPVNPVNVLTGGLRLQRRDHRKLVVIDGRVAILGGINISDVYGSVSSGGRRSGGSQTSGGSGGDDPPFEKRPWRDLQVRIDGPVVADLQRAFIKQWQRTKKELLDDKAYFPPLKPEGVHVVRAVETSPAEQGVNTLYLALISAIESAETEVLITNAYFVPHPQLLEALRDAARRGVDVKLILPSKTDHALVYHAGRSYYEDLLETGVKIFERKTRMLHSKSAVIDGVWSTVGSTNLDWRSLVYNDELNAVVLGPEFARQMNAVFAKDLANSEEITRDQWARRPLKDRLKEVSARAWAYLL
jgi:cardiolipin synthase